MLVLLLPLPVLLLSYLLGAVPFGYLVAWRVAGIDIREHGSHNIGATNVGRVLGWRFGVLTFVLDFAKGAVPVALALLLARTLPADSEALPNLLPVAAGLGAFLGHLFPVYLRFRGGKGVATGAGVVAVLVPVCALGAIAAWALVLLLRRTMSLASLTAAAVLCGTRLGITPDPFGRDQLVITAFCLLGAALVVARHATNIARLWLGTEPRL
jgi:glycerol-3-phosphate acyltransferase PlsY